MEALVRILKWYVDKECAMYEDTLKLNTVIDNEIALLTMLTNLTFLNKFLKFTGCIEYSYGFDQNPCSDEVGWVAGTAVFMLKIELNNFDGMGSYLLINLYGLILIKSALIIFIPVLCFQV